MSSDNVIYFDNSATSWPKPRETGEAMMYYLNDVGANPYPDTGVAAWRRAR